MTSIHKIGSYLVTPFKNGASYLLADFAKVSKIALPVLMLLASAAMAFYFYRSKTWKSPEPLKLGYNGEQDYKPRIILTGEKIDRTVLESLQKYSNPNQQQVTWVELDQLKTHTCDRSKDLLLVVFHKAPGNHPVRGFAAWDGGLAAYAAPLLAFSNKTALVIICPGEDTVASVQSQLVHQMKQITRTHVMVKTTSLWDIAHQVQALLKPQGS